MVGIWLKEHGRELHHAGAMFPLILGKTDGVNHYILEQVRPKANQL